MVRMASHDSKVEPQRSTASLELFVDMCVSSMATVLIAVVSMGDFHPAKHRGQQTWMS